MQRGCVLRVVVNRGVERCEEALLTPRQLGLTHDLRREAREMEVELYKGRSKLRLPLSGRSAVRQGVGVGGRVDNLIITINIINC